MRDDQFMAIRCPVCGALPEMDVLYEPWEEKIKKRNRYKAFCPNGHVECGDWKKTKMSAWKDWLKRRVDKTQPCFLYARNVDELGLREVEDIAEFLADPWAVYRRIFGDSCVPWDKEERKRVIKEWLEKPASGEYPKGYPEKC